MNKEGYIGLYNIITSCFAQVQDRDLLKGTAQTKIQTQTNKGMETSEDKDTDTQKC